jgi:hypothetical protein
VGGDVPVDSETLLVTDFVNLKIKSIKSFEGAHRDRMCVHRVSNHTYMSIYVYTILKNHPLIWSRLNYGCRLGNCDE